MMKEIRGRIIHNPSFIIHHCPRLTYSNGTDSQSIARPCFRFWTIWRISEISKRYRCASLVKIKEGLLDERSSTPGSKPDKKSEPLSRYSTKTSSSFLSCCESEKSERADRISRRRSFITLYLIPNCKLHDSAIRRGPFVELPFYPNIKLL